MISGRAALLTGVGIDIISLRQWIFTSVAVSTIGSARLEWPGSTLLFVGYMVLSSWLIVGLLLLKVVRPNAAPDVMDRIAAWTERHLGSILARVAIVLGVLVLGFGLCGWLS